MDSVLAYMRVIQGMHSNNTALRACTMKPHLGFLEPIFVVKGDCIGVIIGHGEPHHTCASPFGHLLH